MAINEPLQSAKRYDSLNSDQKNRPLVLVADDDEINRFLCRESLSSAGFDVIEVENSAEAIERAKEVQPDIILLDVVMAPMDAYTACRQIRKDKAMRGIPVVMMTGSDENGSVATAYDAGATDFISKPIAPVLLTHRLRYVHRASCALSEMQANREELALSQRIARLGGIRVKLPGGRTQISREARAVLGLPAGTEEVPIRSLLKRLPSHDLRRLMRELSDALMLRTPLSTEIRYRQNSMNTLTLSLRAEAEFEMDEPSHIHFIVQDVSELKEAEARVRYLAHHDVLTGLANRTSFELRVVEALKSSGRRQRKGALHLIDLFRFKEINDTMGHAIGDQLLQQVAERLTNQLRAEDFMARLGGDEFAILQTAAVNDEQAELFARRILEAFDHPFEFDGHRIAVSASIGFITYPCANMSCEGLLGRADLALHSAKSMGQQNLRMFEPSMDTNFRARKQIEQDVRDAYDRHWYELHFQPQFSAAHGGIVGAEALLRLNHPTHGMMKPANFVPIVEDLGLILPLGRWIIREACLRAARFQVNGKPLRVAVNLSAIQLQDSELFLTIHQSLEASGLPPSCLELEITESMIMADPQHASAVLGRIRDLGVAIAIDDFGTGYSSFQQLRRFPLDRIKIDRSFICDIATENEAKAIVQTILDLCNTLDLSTTAEGVETEEQLAFLNGSDCEEIQGFLLSRPLDAKAFFSFINSSNEKPLLERRRRNVLIQS